MNISKIKSFDKYFQSEILVPCTKIYITSIQKHILFNITYLSLEDRPLLFKNNPSVLCHDISPSIILNYRLSSSLSSDWSCWNNALDGNGIHNPEWNI